MPRTAIFQLLVCGTKWLEPVPELLELPVEIHPLMTTPKYPDCGTKGDTIRFS